MPVFLSPRLSTGILFVLMGVWGTQHASADLAWRQNEITLNLAAGEQHAVASFQFKNTGSEPVTIFRADANCGCVTAKPEKKIYAAGESGNLEAHYQAESRTATSSTRIILVYTSEKTNLKKLTLHIDATKPVTIVPQNVSWAVMEPPSEKEQVVTIAAGITINVSAVTSTNGNFEVRLETIKPGKSYAVKIKPRDTTHPSKARLKFETDFAEPIASFARVVARK